MTTESDLMRAVCERPFADEPRLVYADWLDEHGEPEKANFIRMQIAGRIPSFTKSQLSAIDCEYGLQGMGYKWSETISPGLDSFTVRRGFVDSVALPLSRFVGGRCDGERCDRGQIYIGQDNLRWIPCPKCHGTGRSPGLAPALAKWPITSVTLTDREPYVGETKASWYDESQRHESTRFRLSSLPTSLYRRLSDGVGNGPYTPYGRWYDCRESALADLSCACVDLIRSLAEPPLPGIRWELAGKEMQYA